MKNQVKWDEITHKLQNNDGIFIDVRTEAEFASARVESFKLIPLGEAFLNNLEGHLTTQVKKDVNVYFMCRSGMRSENARALVCDLLHTFNGYAINYYNISGGILSRG